MPTYWNIITAGPSAGKTSTLRELSARGLATAPEAARNVIDKLISEGWEPEEVYNHENFQELVIEEDLRIEDNLYPYRRIFSDRSLADNIAYLRHKEMEVPEEIIRKAKNRYKNVFLLDQLQFNEDYSRSEDAEEAEQLHEEIRKAYKDLGYDITEVPLMPIDKRVDYILNRP